MSKKLSELKSSYGIQEDDDEDDEKEKDDEDMSADDNAKHSHSSSDEADEDEEEEDADEDEQGKEDADDREEEEEEEEDVDEEDDEDEEDEKEEDASLGQGRKGTKSGRKGRGKNDTDSAESDDSGDTDGDDSHMRLDEEEETDVVDEHFLQKFKKQNIKDFIIENHPECLQFNALEISLLAVVVRNEHGDIVDDLHTTVPLLTKYERTRIIGQRALQLNAGAKSYIEEMETTVDGIVIAERELSENKIPFFIRRILPNGKSEIWDVRDLEQIHYTP